MARYLTVPPENIERCLNSSGLSDPEPIIVDERFVGLQIGPYRIYPEKGGQLTLSQKQPELS
jgi:hypothetical protein